MRIIKELPPNIDQIDECFKVKHIPSILYTFGSEVYTLSDKPIPIWIMKHEEVHSARQFEYGRMLMEEMGMEPDKNEENSVGPVEWWKRYIDDPEFRLLEELVAHQVEWRVFGELHNRNERRLYLNAIAARLSNEMYGRMVSLSKAKILIKDKE